MFKKTLKSLAFTHLMRASRAKQLIRLIRFAAARLAFTTEQILSGGCPPFTSSVVFDISTERLFKRYLFSIARCLGTQGVRVDFCFRLRFVVRDVEPGDYGLLIRHPFRFVCPIFLRCLTFYTYHVREGECDEISANLKGKLRGIVLASDELSMAADEFWVPLTLGPTYIFDHHDWTPGDAALAEASFKTRTINIFFSGALHKPAYQNCQILNEAGILGRVQIAEFLKLSADVYGIEYVTDYGVSHAMLTDGMRRRVVIVEAQTAGFSGVEYRNILLRARFFLALPGIASIYTHSLVESLSCGLVPIIQKSSQLPAVFVDGRNCLLFSDLNDLCDVIRTTEHIDECRWAELSANALQVYRDVFSPEALGRDIWQALQQGKTLKIIQA